MRKVLVIVMVVLAVAACSKKEVKVQTEDSKLALEAFKLAETLRQAYVAKDLKALEDNTTEHGLQDIQRQLKDFESVELDFQPRWVDIESDSLVLNVSWKGTWQIRGREQKDRGMAVFELTGHPLKLNKILRSNPFKNPE